jgi:magnesium-transporting ATPase (P-type)
MNHILSTIEDGSVKPEFWYRLPADEVLNRVKSSADEGLSDSEVSERLAHLGPNEIETQTGPTRWMMVMHQFKDPLIYILLIAAFITFVLQDYADSGVILGVVILNAVIGFIQETKAQKAIESLKYLSAPRAIVIRNGRETEIPGRELVPGDIVLLTTGGRVAADMRVLQMKGLEVDESALTGESMISIKQSEPLEAEDLVPGDQNNMLFMGTIVARGRARAVVVRTGRFTELGKIATSVRQIGITHTPLQDKVEHLGQKIGLIIVGLSLFIAAVGIYHQMNPYEVFVTVVALVVSAIPEGLPVVMTITLAIGVRRMARRNAIIRSLPAVETLGSTTVIGSDKTGTLTQNQMTVTRIWADNHFFTTTGVGYQLEGDIIDGETEVMPKGDSGLYQTLLSGALANEANADLLLSGNIQGDPTEIALHVAAIKGGIELTKIHITHQQKDILPFEPERQFMATMNSQEGKKKIFLKGSPEVIAEKCTHRLVNGKLVPIDLSVIFEAVDKLAADGLRVLAMAFKDWEGPDLSNSSLWEGNFIFAGLQGMEDPIRPEAQEAVGISQRAGIRVMMITGDHIETAVAIGNKLGLDNDGHGALEGKEIDRLSDDELDLRLKLVNIFARVSPQHKLRIIERLKMLGHIVAVTGDGVNDAPALKSAHLGAAMGRSGTDVAREAADMVLSDDNFTSITSAIEEGRIVFSNIRKVTFFLLSTAVGEIIVIMAAILMNWPLPFVAVQILWINMVTNGLQDVALAFEPGEPGILKRKPRPVNEGIMTSQLTKRLGGVGLVLAAGTLGMFWWTLEETGDIQIAQSAAMTQMVIFQFFHVLNCRSLDRSIFKIPLFSNKFLFISLAAAITAHLAVLHIGVLQSIFRTVPLDAEQWTLIVITGFLVIIGGEIDKIVNRYRKSYIG